MGDGGLRLDVVRADGSAESVADFAVTGIPYMDLVFALRTVAWLESDDVLRLRFNVPVISCVDGVETNRYTEDWEYEREFTRQTQVTHFRFTKIGDEAWLEMFDGEPTMDRPQGEGAEKIR